MPRVEAKTFGWGVLQDEHGNARVNEPFTLSTTTYTDATGSTAAPVITTSHGEIPGFIEPGTYTLTAGGVTQQVEATTGTGTTPGDLTVTNAKVSTTAAIVGSKLDLTSGTGGATFTLPAAGHVSIVNAPSGDTRTLMVGRSDGNAGAAGHNDFCFDHDTDQLLVRKFIIGEAGDVAGMVMRRSGGATYNGTMTQMLDGTAIGGVRWQAHDGTSQTSSGWTGGTPTGNAYLAKIGPRLVGDATKSNRGADLSFETTTQDDATCVSQVRLTIKHDGKLTIAAPTNSSLVATPAKDNLALTGGANTGITFNSDTNIYCSASNVLKTDDQFVAVDGITTKPVAGAVSDGSFTTTPASGTIAVDTTNSKIYVRVGSTWKSVTVA